jgi:O-acetyl-ADP-ribose deacetylase (regulator of RNase III)
VLEGILRWGETYIDDRALADGSTGTFHTSPFPYDPELNMKLAVHFGTAVELPVDAIVNPTSERLTDRSGQTQHLYDQAGKGFARESSAQSLDSLGATALVKGGNLLAKHVIHTVGPRYQQKYITAAENALHKCYRNTMAVCREQIFTTVAYIPLHKKRVRDEIQYPRDSGAHTALRTLRRCLEKWGDTIKLVIVAADDEVDFEVFKSVAPLYFPRNKAEETNALFLLPDNTGNENGELILKERMIRIEGAVADPLLDEMEALEAKLATLRTRELAEQKQGNLEARGVWRQTRGARTRVRVAGWGWW